MARPKTTTRRSPARIALRLYLAGDGPNSLRARHNLEELCRTFPEIQVECIDVLKQPALALQDKIIATPTLVKVSPPPSRRIIGALNNPEEVLALLGISLKS